MTVYLILDATGYPVHGFMLKEDADAFVSIHPISAYRVLRIVIQR